MRRRTILIATALALVALVGVYKLHRSRTYQLFGRIIHHVDAMPGYVALTFDDGPIAGRADEMLDLLRDERVPATFYVTGEGLSTRPELGRRLVADGHELGNHTYHHRPMILRSQAYIAGEIERTDSLIRLAGYRGTITFRPPYTKKRVGLPRYLARRDRLTVTFDVEPESDPAMARDTERIVQEVLRRTRTGSIILLHPWARGGEASRRAVPRIVAALRARGYEFVTVGELQNHWAE